MSKRIPVAGPWITQKEVDYVADAAANAWFSRAGEWYDRFEKAFAAYLGVPHAVSVTHCTAAIHLSLAAKGIGPGDEVILPDATWIASVAPVTYVGATPVFADVDPETWCLSAESLAACITDRTRAVIPVGLYGSMPDYDAIRAVTDAHGLFVLEDAAEALGSEYKGKKAGSLGDTGVFSFHGSKTLTTGEGGLLATSDPELFARILFLRDHGRTPGDVMFFNAEVGYKYKMSSMQAAMGLAQLERVEELVGKKREIFSWYRDRLSGVDGLSLNAEPDGVKNSFWMSTVVLSPDRGMEKPEFMAKMAEKGVDTRPFFHPLSFIPAFRDSPQAQEARKRNLNAYRVCPYGVNLPSGLQLVEDDVDRVCAALLEILG
ncbi:MAG: DegT/DnrJ/EryC1/StrS family aminotransferase [Proteobacteria bacterium]|nr:DegT/DnrJ/EryC1/StrS family aminotransferase [Pseudomonadota bacterium]